MAESTAVPPDPQEPAGAPEPEEADRSSSLESLGRIVFGQPRDLRDRRLFHKLSLVPFLAWVGLGADGLSSSCYGPEEAFRALLRTDPATGAVTSHTYLAVPLALLTALTVAVIAACYMRLIEVFPHAGGGYLVATKLLGRKLGIVAGSALIVDYVLTITVSVAAAGSALFSLLPLDFQRYKLVVEIACILLLIVLNIRGVRESILVLLPIFITFLVAHLILISSGILFHIGDIVRVSTHLHGDFRVGLSTIGALGMLGLFLQAYSMGGGTYTGLEAVSNGLAVMRAPQVQTGKRTMVYMAISLSFTAAGLILCYLLLDIAPVEGRTMNALLARDLLGLLLPTGEGLRSAALVLTIASEGALLIVGAQAGFVGGPRLMAVMAVDSVLPHRFAALSDRLTVSNGVALMGLASLAALVLTGGDIHVLILMYSINVFLTFSLAQLGMMRYWWQNRGRASWKRRLALFTVGFVFCSAILVGAVYEKFTAGGWVTLVTTGCLVAVCLVIKGYYSRVGRMIAEISAELEDVREVSAKVPEFDPGQPTAVLLVSSFGGLGVHTILKICQLFPGHFRNFHFLSVGTIDSGNFKGSEELEGLERSTAASLKRYVEVAHGLGFPARSSFSIGPDTVDELEKLCRATAPLYRSAVFFSGKLIFEREAWYHAIFHNQTAFALQKRLQWSGLMLVILPLRIFERRPGRKAAGRIAAEVRGAGAEPQLGGPGTPWCGPESPRGTSEGSEACS